HGDVGRGVRYCSGEVRVYGEWHGDDMQEVMSSPGKEEISSGRSIRNYSQQTHPQQMPHLEPCKQGSVNGGRL
nr:hypothetical protein [Tanacetum cinerariifolium]